ncbi:hypothetical protein AJ78_04420 [Emergomyces pasteurianus Ep9510]|uniref:Uncharacterized protein n=1 Tax=Emergomyces pasteurianus Ep9510 TaxID=1447872 RepID=A0A1J9QGK7_9EURO|nr:hypothetical protein AJ78_04420 [Emergomyces pasteurianus Ep9510]
MLRSKVLSIIPPSDDGLEIPTISDDEPVGTIIRKLSNYIIQAIPDTPYSIDQMRATAAGYPLKGLATSLSDNVHNPAIISALIDTIEYLLDELSETYTESTSEVDTESYVEQSFVKPQMGSSQNDDERRPLLFHASPLSRLLGYGTRNITGSKRNDRQTGTNSSEEGVKSDAYVIFIGLNVLEIATIANAKKLLSQTIVQKVVSGMWSGAIVLWDSLSVYSKKKPQLFHKRMTDPYCRLRVPLYRKSFEAVFFLSFLALYYSVLMARDPLRISPAEASLMVCSLMSLNSYFGSLTKAFLKFLPVVAILYIGFLTTFTMLARDRLTLRQMSWILVKAFFGSNSLGFISPLFGYPLMLVFVCMTNILLISSVTSLMSLSLTEIMAHAREEYLFQQNLIPLLCIRPLRLFLPCESIRQVRIMLLKVTHSPFVGIILAYESSRRYVTRTNHSPMATSSSRPHPVCQMRVPPHKLSLRRRQGFSRPMPLPGKDLVPPVLHSASIGVYPGPAADPVRLADVAQTVDVLHSQIEQLAATISSNKNH